MTAKTLVIATLTAVMISWIAGDTYFYVTSQKTITRFVIESSSQYPAVPFLAGLVIGLLCGHLFLQF